MAGRIPMKGDPPPLDRAKMAADLKASTLRMRDDIKPMIVAAEAAGDAKGLKGLLKAQRQVDKLIADYGFDPEKP